jgi:tRNA-modifying protein YgfZ
MQNYSTQSAEPTFLVHLEHQGLLGVEGPDASKFLQGQLTCDLRALPPNHSLLGAQCNLKGRMLSTVRLLQDRDDRIILRTFAELIGATQEALGKYIVFSKASLRDLTNLYTRVGLLGPQAQSLLSARLGAVPEADGDWLSHSGHLIIRLAENRYECWLDSDTAPSLLAALSPHCRPGDENLWTLQDIRAGWADLRPETREKFTPQALNYPLVGGVSFRKGCYTGQEVVARLHYKGTLKRHMYRVALPWPEQTRLPSPGEELKADDGGLALGQCILAARSEGELIEALVVMDDSMAAQEEVEFDGKKLRLLQLPYAIHKGD